jgi:hypothetical protein
MQMIKITKTAVFWDVMYCILSEIYWHFGETHYLHLQGGVLHACVQSLLVDREY